MLDIRMPGMDGLVATEELARAMAESAPAIVVVTTFDLDDYVYRAFKAGARGFVTKDSGSAALVAAIRAAADGGGFASADVTIRLIEHYASRDRALPAHQLSHRELAVLRGVASGLTNDELAARDFVSLSTVKSHLSNLMVKLGARNRVELTIYAFRHGLMDR